MSTWTDLGAGMRLPTDAEITVPPITDEQRRRATAVVDKSAHDVDDAALLLAMLGLEPVDGTYRSSARAERMSVDTTAVGPGSVAAPNRGLADRLDTTD